jgi:hypothetical protein
MNRLLQPNGAKTYLYAWKNIVAHWKAKQTAGRNKNMTAQPVASRYTD